VRSPEGLYRERSTGSAALASAQSSPAPISCTANGCAVSAAGATRASSCEQPTTCSRSSDGAFAERARVELEATGERARRRTVETPRRPDPPGKRRSPASRPTVPPTKRSPRNCSSAEHRRLPPAQKQFRKLGVKSRTQLARHLLQPDTRGEPATPEFLTCTHRG